MGGQWVLGVGTEQDGRKCFIVAVEKRDEETLLPMIKNGSHQEQLSYLDLIAGKRTLISTNISYEHRRVSHSVIIRIK